MFKIQALIRYEPANGTVIPGESPWITKTVQLKRYTFRYKYVFIKTNESSPWQIIIHPAYNANSLKNDIALIIVDEPFPLQDNIGVVCLPHQNSYIIQQECLVTGWGKTSHHTLWRSNILKKTILPVVSHGFCQMLLQFYLGSTFTLDSTFICAGGQNKDTCQGDGGSPLMCEVARTENVYVQFGIVSWGLKCGTTDVPGVYVSVVQFVHWIDRQMALHGFHSSVYG
mgnify:FL=1